MTDKPDNVPNRSGLSMIESGQALSLLAGLLEYPGPDCRERWEKTRLALSELHPAAGDAVACFQGTMRQVDDQPEAVFLRTFEICPTCSPYLTIHLFGEENYQRGDFMARLKQRFLEVGLDSRNELPDHLGSILRFFELAGENERQDLIRFCLLGPLRKMIELLEGGGTVRNKTAGAPANAEIHNPYACVLRAVEMVLRDGYPHLRPEPMPSERNRDTGCTIAFQAGGSGAGCNAGCAMPPHAVPYPSPDL